MGAAWTPVGRLAPTVSRSKMLGLCEPGARLTPHNLGLGEGETTTAGVQSSPVSSPNNPTQDSVLTPEV